MMTKEEFITHYKRNHGLHIMAQYHTEFDATPCDCKMDSCLGWNIKIKVEKKK